MDFITIVTTIFQYGLTALAIAAGLSLLYVLGYWIYKKGFHGTKTVSKKQWVVLALLSAWYLLVLGLTIFSRGANFTGSFNFSLFSGYLSAWNQWSYTELQLILFNMLMFAPLGFLLPFLSPKGEKFGIACLISFLVTLSIEVIQLISGKGIFELDDLLHNFIGSLFGYFVSTFLLDCIRCKRVHWKPLVKMLVIPLVFSIGISTAVLVYEQQEYGNFAFIPAQKQNMSQVSVKTQIDLSDQTGTVSVYQNARPHDLEHGKQISQSLTQLTGTVWNQSIRTEGNTKIFLSVVPGNVQLSYFMDNGTWSYTNWNPGIELTEAQSLEYRAEIETWLKQNDLLPNGAVFRLENGDTLRWDMQAREPAQGTSDYDSGCILVKIDQNGQIASFDYWIFSNRFVRQEEIISPKDACQQVLDGNFEQYVPFQSGDALVIENWDLTYAYDTKGYYRPVYQFAGHVNQEDWPWECKISAIR